VARPIEEIDEQLIDWIQSNILQEGVVKRVIAEVRRRIEKQSKTHGPDVDRLDTQIAKLRKEVRNCPRPSPWPKCRCPLSSSA
jgi:hypothetical protein